MIRLKSLLVVMFVLALLLGAAPASSEESNYGYWFREVVFINSNGNVLRDVILNVSVDTTSIKFASDCSDIVFTDESGNVIPHAIMGGCKTSQTIIYVYIGDVQPNQTRKLRMYYGMRGQNRGVDLKTLLSHVNNKIQQNATAGDIIAPHLYDLSFNGINQYAVIGLQPDGSGTPFTVYGWSEITIEELIYPVWPKANTLYSLFSIIGDWWTTTEPTTTYETDNRADYTRIFLRFATRRADGTRVLYSYDIIAYRNTWVHIIRRFTSAREFSVWVNGSRVYTATVPSTEATIIEWNPDTATYPRRYKRFVLGANMEFSGWMTVRYGYVRIYDRAITSNEISQAYSQKVVNVSGLKVFIDPTFFDGTKYIDLSGNGNHAYPYNGPQRVEAKSKWLWRVVGGGTSGNVTLAFMRGYYVRVQGSDDDYLLYVAGDSVGVRAEAGVTYTVTMYLPTFTYPTSVGSEQVVGSEFLATGISTALFRLPPGDYVLYDSGGFIRLRTGSSDACLIVLDENISRAYDHMIVYSLTNYSILYEGEPTNYCSTQEIALFFSRVRLEPLRVQGTHGLRNTTVSPDIKTLFNISEFLKSLGFIGWLIFLAFPASVWLYSKDVGLTLSATAAAFIIALMTAMPSQLLQLLAVLAGVLVGYAFYRIFWGD